MSVSAVCGVQLLLAAAAIDYCNLACCPGGTHTMCLYPSCEPAASCQLTTPPDVGVTAADQQAILSAHNAVRRDVKAGNYVDKNLPAAAEMPPLTWDAQLAEVAQRWTNQCQFRHDQCRDLPQYQVNQNAAMTVGADKDWTQAVKNWLDEIDNFKQRGLIYTSSIDPVSGKIIGHFTQLIWAKTTKIGCGYIATESSFRKIRRLYFCNYATAGNVPGEEIYVAA